MLLPNGARSKRGESETVMDAGGADDKHQHETNPLSPLPAPPPPTALSLLVPGRDHACPPGQHFASTTAEEGAKTWLSTF